MTSNNDNGRSQQPPPPLSSMLSGLSLREPSDLEEPGNAATATTAAASSASLLGGPGATTTTSVDESGEGNARTVTTIRSHRGGGMRRRGRFGQQQQQAQPPSQAQAQLQAPTSPIRSASDPTPAGSPGSYQLNNPQHRPSVAARYQAMAMVMGGGGDDDDEGDVGIIEDADDEQQQRQPDSHVTSPPLPPQRSTSNGNSPAQLQADARLKEQERAQRQPSQQVRIIRRNPPGRPQMRAPGALTKSLPNPAAPLPVPLTNSNAAPAPAAAGSHRSSLPSMPAATATANRMGSMVSATETPQNANYRLNQDDDDDALLDMDEAFGSSEYRLPHQLSSPSPPAQQRQDNRPADAMAIAGNADSARSMQSVESVVQSRLAAAQVVLTQDQLPDDTRSSTALTGSLTDQEIKQRELDAAVEANTNLRPGVVSVQGPSSRSSAFDSAQQSAVDLASSDSPQSSFRNSRASSASASSYPQQNAKPYDPVVPRSSESVAASAARMSGRSNAIRIRRGRASAENNSNAAVAATAGSGSGSGSIAYPPQHIQKGEDDATVVSQATATTTNARYTSLSFMNDDDTRTVSTDVSNLFEEKAYAPNHQARNMAPQAPVLRQAVTYGSAATTSTTSDPSLDKSRYRHSSANSSNNYSSNTHDAPEPTTLDENQSQAMETVEAIAPGAYAVEGIDGAVDDEDYEMYGVNDDDDWETTEEALRTNSASLDPQQRSLSMSRHSSAMAQQQQQSSMESGLNGQTEHTRVSAVGQLVEQAANCRPSVVAANAENNEIENQMKQEQEQKQRRKYLMIGGGCVLCLIIVIVVVVVVALLAGGDDGGGNNNNIPEREEPKPDIKRVDRLKALVQPVILNDNDFITQTLSWMSIHDTTSLDLKDKIQQRFILLLFYVSLGIANPIVSLGSSDECVWSGIECTPNGSVIGIESNRRGLRGTIPMELQFLSGLESISLQTNSISGTIGAQFKTMSQLSKLALYQNEIEAVELDQIHPNLRFLQVSLNPITKPIVPAHFGRFGNLEHLDMSQTGIEVPVASIFNNLSRRMEFIALDDNELFGTLPNDLSRFTTMYQLMLRNNKIEQRIPTEIGSLTTLQLLELSQNLFTGAIPSEIGKLTDMKSLAIRVCELSEPLPTEIGLLSEIRVILVDGNLMRGRIPSEMGQLSTFLDHLGLSVNQFEGSIPTELGNMSKMITLNMHTNDFTGTIPSELGNISKLGVVTIFNNEQLSGSVPTEICELTNLSVIQIPFSVQCDCDGNLCFQE